MSAVGFGTCAVDTRSKNGWLTYCFVGGSHSVYEVYKVTTTATFLLATAVGYE